MLGSAEPLCGYEHKWIFGDESLGDRILVVAGGMELLEK